MMDFATASAGDIAAAIRDKQVSSVEVTQAALNRLQQAHEKCNSVVAFENEEALAAAKKADEAVAAGEELGPIHGVPLAHKDMFDRVGKIPSWGGNIQPDKPASEDATLIARLKAAGSHQIAALHLTEFAYGPIGHNYVLGHARNPWNPDHVSGGASSGTAMSVATGCIPAGLGSDTAGSLRLPASACGITSLKPTWSLITPIGAMALAPSLDAVGPMARHVNDLALLMSIMAGHDPRIELSSQSGVMIGVDEKLISEADASVHSRVEDALKAVEATGCRRVSVQIDNWQTLDHLAQLVQLSEAAALHANFLRHRVNDYGPQVRTRVEFGHFVSAHDFQTALRARGAMLQKLLNEVYKSCDVVILPNFAGPIPTIAELDVGGGPQLMAALGKVMKYSRPLNYLGLPALTLPYPSEDGELPNGFQLMGRPFSEARLLSIGTSYQGEVPPLLAPLT